jgi:ubiquinone/menaquinone biosynthesis C-methylase UbiE
MTDADSAHDDEYHDALIDMLELIWGQGFLIPDGPANVRRILDGVDVDGKRVLDIGSGIGGPALMMARAGAAVTGIDLEAPLVARAEAYAAEAGLSDRVSFRCVEPGPLPFGDAAFDIVYSSGAFTQVDDKPAMFAEAFRVLKPGGVLVSYDWMKNDAPAYSDAMLYWFKMEGLTYAMETLDAHGRLLEAAGFAVERLEDDGGAYQRLAREEYDKMRGPLDAAMLDVLGREHRDHFHENWRAMVAVLDSGELRPGFYRARKPA